MEDDSHNEDTLEWRDAVHETRKRRVEKPVNSDKRRKCCGRGWRSNSYCTKMKDIIDICYVEQSMEMDPDYNTKATIFEGQSSSAILIHQQIVDQFARGTGGLLREDRHLLDHTNMEEVIKADMRDQIEWLELVVHARNRAKAWDTTQYTRERNVLQSWLR